LRKPVSVDGWATWVVSIHTHTHIYIYIYDISIESPPPPLSHPHTHTHTHTHTNTGIDDTYDVAVSTASGALDFLVVETAKGGAACVEYLRKNNLGR
jgi:hypothetical protein